jgi:hypothetical protein
VFSDGEAHELATGPDETTGDWLEQELDDCEFPDERLGARFQKLIHQLSNDIGGAHSFGLQGCGQYESRLPFLSNKRVRDQQILAGHFQATREDLLPQRCGADTSRHDGIHILSQRSAALDQKWGQPVLLS